MKLQSSCFAFLALPLLPMLAWNNLAVAEKVWFKTEEVISAIHGSDGEHVADLCAKANTIVNLGDHSLPDVITFATPVVVDGTVRGKVEAEYGTDGTKPKNSGPIFYRATSAMGMPYIVTGPKGIHLYHLKYLELTTVKKDNGKYVAYLTKAVAFDNKVVGLGGQIGTFTLPDGGDLALDHGMMRIGDDCISPNYDLSGQIVVPAAASQPASSQPTR